MKVARQCLSFSSFDKGLSAITILLLLKSYIIWGCLEIYLKTIWWQINSPAFADIPI